MKNNTQSTEKSSTQLFGNNVFQIKFMLMVSFLLLFSACGYHLRSNNKLAEMYPRIKVNMASHSMLKRSLVTALLSSGVKLEVDSGDGISELRINKNSLRKVIQSIGPNNQVQEYRLEYDVEYTIADKAQKSIHLEKDYSFDIQQIGGGQQEEITLRKQLAEDMARAIIRQLSVSADK
jgi:outer membrane lipopolysaccharide assembly protein LptE/RlpB